MNAHKRGFELYGGRGISVCKRWLVFENFLADMGNRPSRNHSVERRDNNKGYEPGNCLWATKKEQQRNRRTNRLVTILGETLPMAAWAERYKIHPNTICWRIDYGKWDVTAAVTMPAGRGRK